MNYFIIIGILFSIALHAILSVYSDDQKERLEIAEKLCDKLDSKPRSFDRYTITCENYTQVSFESKKK